MRSNMHWLQINLCIQLLVKQVSTFHTNHKQNLNDICPNFNRYERKLLEKTNAKITLERKILEHDIIDFDKNINENYFGEKDSWFLYLYFPVCEKVSRTFLSIVIFINIFVNIIFFFLQESNIIDVIVNDIVFFNNSIFKNLFL